MAVKDDIRRSKNRTDNVQGAGTAPITEPQTVQPEQVTAPIPQTEQITTPVEATKTDSLQMPTPGLAPVTTKTPEGRVPTTLEEIIALRAPKQPSPEELEKERKRERSKAIITALSDGISSIANLYGATKGAVSTPQVSLSEVNRKRYEQVIANREKKREEYIAALERAGMANVAQQYKEQEQKSQQEFELKKSRMSNRANRKEGERDRAFRAEQSAADRDAKQQSLTAQQQFTAGQNAADRAIHERRITAQDAKDKQTRIHNFQKNQGDEIPLVINGKTYVVGSNAIDKNVGNIVANIMDDLRDSPKFKDKTDKQLSRDPEWLQANMALNTSRNDVKKLAETMKLYAKDSPSAMKTIQQLSDYYDREKKAAEIGESDYLEDFGFVPAGSKNVNVDDLFD